MKKQARLIVTVILLASVFTAACSSTPHQESAGEFLDNSLITAKVKSRLIDDQITGGFSISVHTYKGVVRLTGTVRSEKERQYAASIASGVTGVRGVDNQLVISAE